MKKIVLDSSAALAALRYERGGDEVLAILEDPDAQITMSALNFSEMASRLVRDGMKDEDIRIALEPYRHLIIPFDEEHAERTGLLFRQTSAHGLSLGDRACLVLARSLRAEAWTADQAWKHLKVGVKIVMVRTNN